MATNSKTPFSAAASGEKLARRLCFDLRREADNFTRLFDFATREDDDYAKIRANDARSSIEQIRNELTTITDVSDHQLAKNGETLQIAHDL